MYIFFAGHVSLCAHIRCVIYSFLIIVKGNFWKFDNICSRSEHSRHKHCSHWMITATVLHTISCHVGMCPNNKCPCPCIFVAVNFDALAQASDFRIERRQVVFLCWEQDSNPGGLWNPIFSRPNACWQTDWAIEDQAKNLNWTARPYDQQAFSPPDPTAIWHSHLALVIYIFVVVNFYALAQASDFRIERRQVVFLCWELDSNPGGLWNPIFSRLNACCAQTTNAHAHVFLFNLFRILVKWKKERSVKIKMFLIRKKCGNVSSK